MVNFFFNFLKKKKNLLGYNKVNRSKSRFQRASQKIAKTNQRHGIPFWDYPEFRPDLASQNTPNLRWTSIKLQWSWQTTSHPWPGGFNKAPSVLLLAGQPLRITSTLVSVYTPPNLVFTTRTNQAKDSMWKHWFMYPKMFVVAVPSGTFEGQKEQIVP